MKVEQHAVPRVFNVGVGHQISLADCGRILLAPDEQVTFISDDGAEYDVTRKAWGYYATPSINGRLRSHGFKTALVRSDATARYFVLLVRASRLADFEKYAQEEQLQLVEWLDERG